MSTYVHRDGAPRSPCATTPVGNWLSPTNTMPCTHHHGCWTLSYTPDSPRPRRRTPPMGKLPTTGAGESEESTDGDPLDGWAGGRAARHVRSESARISEADLNRVPYPRTSSSVSRTTTGQGCCDANLVNSTDPRRTSLGRGEWLSGLHDRTGPLELMPGGRSLWSAKRCANRPRLQSGVLRIERWRREPLSRSADASYSNGCLDLMDPLGIHLESSSPWHRARTGSLGRPAAQPTRPSTGDLWPATA